MFTCPWYPKQKHEAKRNDVPYGHASMLQLGEGSQATEPYNKFANLFKCSNNLKKIAAVEFSRHLEFFENFDAFDSLLL